MQSNQVEKDAHYPAAWGLDFIPNPNAIADGSGESNASLTGRGTYSQRFATIFDNTKALDPHLHGDMTSTVARGFGYHYYSKSPFPDSYDIVHRRGGGEEGFAFGNGERKVHIQHRFFLNLNSILVCLDSQMAVGIPATTMGSR